MKEKYKKYIMPCIIGLILTVCIVWIVIQNTDKTAGRKAEIRVSGEVVQTLDLSIDKTVTVHGKNGIDLTVIVSDGGIYVEKSDCPDKICVHKGKISNEDENIICLPAQTIIEVK